MKRSPIDPSEAPAYPSPLWILALFIALSEATAGIAAVVADGPTQMIFTVFAVVFPIAVLITFIWLLLKHPGNLYSPWQYTQQTSVEGYVAALSRESRTAAHVYSQAIGEAIASAAPDSGAATSGQIALAFERRVQASSVTIGRDLLLDGAEPIQIPVTPETTLDELLDSVFLAIRPAVAPFTYGEAWVLATEPGALLTEMGTKWAKAKGRPRDERALAEVGISPGSKLRLLRPPLRSANGEDVG